MRSAWAIALLFFLIAGQVATGFAGLVAGAESLSWRLWLHSIGAYAIVLLLAWRAAGDLGTTRTGRRRIGARPGFVAAGALLLATLGTGLLWTFGGRRLVFQYSLITVHVGLAVALLAFVLWQALSHRLDLRRERDDGRRALLRLGVTVAGGAALAALANRAVHFFNLPGARRRFTGSYETGSFGGDFPTVSWLFDNPPLVDGRQWRLLVEGAVERPLSFDYEQLAQMAGDTLVAVIDCTGGWYAAQEWQGVNVGRILEMVAVKGGARSVSFEAVSGYGRRFALAEARGYLLALRVAGQVLDHGHGFPARLVAPEHRGFEWVKWLSRITVNESGELWQPPVPLQ